jgi:hypothetical protein
VPDFEQTGLHAVVKVGRQVGNFVGEIDDLGFEGRTLVQEVAGQFGIARRIIVAGVFDDALPHPEGQVESPVRGVALFKMLHDAQSVQIMVEAEAVALKAGMQSALSGMTEGGMADIVDQRQGLRQILVQSERGGDVAGDLGDFNGVGQPGAEVVRRAAGEHLGLSGESAKCPGLNDPVAIALKRAAKGPLRSGKDPIQQHVAACLDHSAGRECRLYSRWMVL